MRNVLFFGLLPALTAAVVLGACTKSTSESEENLTPDGGDPVITDPPGTNGPSGGGEEGGATDGGATNTPAPATGLPCEIEYLLATHCLGCHSGAAGAPPLRTYDELMAKSFSDPNKTRAQVALDQMKAGTMPRPPKTIDAENISVFEKWITDQTPKNDKSCAEPEGDGGVTDGGKSDGGNGTTQCTSGKTWTGTGNKPNMNPGEACIFCHVNNPTAPDFYFAGTVYATLREPDDCFGKGPPPTITVTITDSRRPRPRTFTMTANEAGNFYLPVRGANRPVAPFSVSISDGTKTRTMPVKAPTGDCNSCHTQNGSNGAPGRILAPN